MYNKVEFLGYVKGSIRTNTYGYFPYREIALVDVWVDVNGETQRCALPFYRSSGTNSGKVRGVWYPILGIKEKDGEFCEFGQYVNAILNKNVKSVSAGWLAKSIFFNVPRGCKNEDDVPDSLKHLRGYSYTSYGSFLKELSLIIKDEFESLNTKKCTQMNMEAYNGIIYTAEKYVPGNTMSQSEVFQRIIMAIVKELTTAI